MKNAKFKSIKSLDGNSLNMTIGLVLNNLFAMTELMKNITARNWKPSDPAGCSTEWRTFIPTAGAIEFGNKEDATNFKRRLRHLESNIARYRTALQSARFNTRENIKWDYTEYLDAATKYLASLRKCKLKVA